MAPKKKKKKFNLAGFLIQLLILAFLCLLFYFLMVLRGRQAEKSAAFASETSASAAVTETAATPEPAELAAEPTATPEPTPEPTPTPTPEPQPEYFTFSFLGDNTLWATDNFVNSEYGLPVMVGEDYAYPYKNTVQYFIDDELTLANLECSFSDEKLAHDYTYTTFPFLAKTSFANILLEGGVDFVTMANNHALDFYQAGVDSTQATLDEYGIPYGYENEGHLITTKNGLKVGIWTAGNDLAPSKTKAEEGVKELREQGAEIVICMFHWGQELYYEPTAAQIEVAHAAIDAGADIVYGTHPHCLQPVETYNGKLIMYSVGNWVFGGNTMPTDADTAIIQVTIKRDVDGTVSYEGFDAIPCCISSNLEAGNEINTSYDHNRFQSYNDYCPTPYEEGSAGYGRVLSKLDGSFVPDSQGADYSSYYASWS